MMALLFIVFLVHTCASAAEPSLDSFKRDHAIKILNEMEESKKSWRDPYDMFGPSATQRDATFEAPSDQERRDIHPAEREKIESSSEIQLRVDDENEMKNFAVSTLQHHQKSNCVSSDMIFLVRWLRIIQNKLSENNIFSSSQTKIVSFSVTEKIINQMEKILSADSPNMRDIEELFVLTLAEFSVTSDQLWTSYITILSTQELVVFVLCTTFLLLSLYVLSKFPRLTFSILIFVLSFSWNWMKLYKREIAAKHARIDKTDVPAACNLKEFGFFGAVGVYFKSWFVDPGDCGKYYEALMVEPFWEVSPSVAVADTISGFLLVPLEVLSRVLNKCFKELLFDLPWLSQVLTVIFFFIILMYIFGYRLRLPFHLGALEPSENAGVFNFISTGVRSLFLHPANQLEGSNVNQIPQNQSGTRAFCHQAEHTCGQVTSVEHTHHLENDMKESACALPTTTDALTCGEDISFSSNSNHNLSPHILFCTNSRQELSELNKGEDSFSVSKDKLHGENESIEKQLVNNTVPAEKRVVELKREKDLVAGNNLCDKCSTVFHEGVCDNPKLGLTVNMPTSTHAFRRHSHQKGSRRTIEE